MDLIIYSNLDDPDANPDAHKAYRLAVKRHLFIRCMKIYSQLFRGTKEILQQRMNKQQNEGDKEDRYYWNCCLEGDEFCQEALKKYNENANVKPGELADRMTQEGMKV